MTTWQKIILYLAVRWFMMVAVKFQNDPIERMFVSIETDFTKAIAQTEEGIGELKKRLEEVEDAVDDTADSGDRFGNILQSAFGRVTGVAGQLFNQVVRLAQQIPQLFKALRQEAISMAAEFEQARITFKNMLGGEQEAADFIKNLREQAAQLGIGFAEASQFAKAIKPDTKSMEDFNELLRLATVGARDANLQVGDLIFSFNEAVAGDFTSIRDRLDIPRDVIAKIRESDDIVASLSEELNKLFEKRGINNLEEFANTMGALQARLTSFRETLLLAAGEFILDEQVAFFQNLLALLESVKTEATIIAGEIGKIAADITGQFRDNIFGELQLDPLINPDEIIAQLELVGEDIQDQDLIKLQGQFDIPPSAMERIDDATFKVGALFDELTKLREQQGTNTLVQGIKDAVAGISDFLKSVQAINDQLGETVALWAEIRESLRIIDKFKFFEKSEEETASFNERLTGLAMGLAIVKAALAAVQAATEPVIKRLGRMAEVTSLLLAGQVKEAFQVSKLAAQELEEGILDIDAGQKAWSDSILQSARDINELKEGVEDVGEAADEVKDKIDDLEPLAPIIDPAQLDSFTTQMINAQERRQAQQEQLETRHGERMQRIIDQTAEKMADAWEKGQEALADLTEDTEEKRLKIIEDARADLADLGADTDRELAERRGEFNKEEQRDTEDHLREMRRLTEQHLLDLEDAVKSRDAGAVRDLQARFAQEQGERQEDFGVTQGRQQQDVDQELAEIRDNEARKREEILANQATALEDLRIHEAERRLEITTQRDETLAELDIKRTDDLQKEQTKFEQQQAMLDQSLARQLESIATAMADQKDVTEEGARQILETLDEVFGAGGDIDAMMTDFAGRRKIRAEIEVEFKRIQEDRESRRLAPGAFGGSGFFAPGELGLPPGIRGFAEGGTLVANKPTLALFGEAGPEVAQFTPMAQLSQGGGGGSDSRMQIEFSGSAPPGFNPNDRDQVARVLLQALRDTGEL